MEMGDAPKSPWRYPHLMFRESRKHKTVSFKKSNGKNGNLIKIFFVKFHFSVGNKVIVLAPIPQKV